MNSTTHWAGPAVTLGPLDRTIQRCMVCGFKLIDSLHQAGPLGPDGKPPGVLVYQAGHLIQITEGNPSAIHDAGELGNHMALPDDFCVNLVEE